ncbi:hypothetical protein BDR04DRAFT_206869 [Suillus decipiens]|nr:hypothetical protein BDR04DRAFT_206869 [Suillus decipiens]
MLRYPQVSDTSSKYRLYREPDYKCMASSCTVKILPYICLPAVTMPANTMPSFPKNPEKCRARTSTPDIQLLVQTATVRISNSKPVSSC